MNPVHVIDVPGHSRLVAKLDEFLSQAAGIVFVVDSVEFLPHLRVASEYVHECNAHVYTLRAIACSYCVVFPGEGTCTIF